MSKPALQILTEARALLSDPKRWTEGDFALDEHGNGVYWHADSAVCWCALGAIGRVAGAEEDPDEGARQVQRFASEAVALLHEVIDWDGVSSMADGVAYWNDHHDHAEVLAAFDRAIELAKGDA